MFPISRAADSASSGAAAATRDIPEFNARESSQSNRSERSANAGAQSAHGGSRADAGTQLLLSVLLGAESGQSNRSTASTSLQDVRVDAAVLSDDEEAKDDLGEVGDALLRKRLIKEHTGAFRVEKVRQSLQMLTGEDGYQQMRQVARDLARHAGNQDEAGLEQLRTGLQSMAPFERFAVARMAAATCDGSVRKSVDSLCDELYMRDHVNIRATMNTVSVISNHLPEREDVNNFCSLYAELLETPQSPRSLVDALLNAPGGDVSAAAKLLRVAARQDLQSEVPSVNRTSLTRMVGYLETMNLSQLASSVMSISADFLKRYDSSVQKGKISAQNMALELVDFGAGNASGPKLDKLMAATLDVARPNRNQKLAYFNDLARAISLLPDLVWSTDGSRDGLRKHLQKRLNEYTPPDNS